MEISQKRLSNATTFLFEEDKLRYSVKDSGGKRNLSVNYSDIPYEDLGELEERNSWFRNVGLLWALLGLVQIGMQLAESHKFTMSIWLILGGICLLFYWFGKTSYTTLDTDAGRIFVIKDGKHDQVMDEIDRRRKAQWKKWYAYVNEAAEPAQELRKFDWLLNKGAISPAEYEAAKIEILQNANGAELAPPAKLLN